MDSDGNGTISQAEYSAYAKANMNTGGENAAPVSQAATTLTWNNIDADKDGKLSATEVESYENLKANFTGMDSDGDGFVTQDEYRAYQKANREPGKP
jgi:Ca2+-binding EF-hand superfamily protein